MIALPPLPSWQGLHPLVIHFPIALLMVAPFFVILGAAVKPERSHPYLLSALWLMVLGTASVFVAVGSGEAAGRLAERSPEINATLEHHEALAERTRMLFSTLTVFFAMIVLVPPWLHRQHRWITTGLPLVFLGLYGAGIVSLVNTAHNGGRLVHEFGVHAVITPSAVPEKSNTASPPHEAE